MDEPRAPSGFSGFLKENWIFIVGPLVVIGLGLIALIVFGDVSPSNFMYNLFG